MHDEEFNCACAGHSAYVLLHIRTYEYAELRILIIQQKLREFSAGEYGGDVMRPFEGEKRPKTARLGSSGDDQSGRKGRTNIPEKIDRVVHSLHHKRGSSGYWSRDATVAARAAS